MSQIMSTHRKASNGHTGGAAVPTGTEHTLWWVLTVQPVRPEICDAVVRQIVTPLIGQARVWGAERCFYRCLDNVSPHVQVHFLVRNGVAGRLKPFAQALAAQCAPELGEVRISEQNAGAYPPRRAEPASPAVEEALALFGGPEGIALTCDVEELSSDLGAWALGRFTTVDSRSPFAALLLFDTAHAMMHGPRSSLWPDRRAPSWGYYWTTHLNSCTVSFGPLAERARIALKARTVPRIVPAHRQMAAIASEPSVDAWRKRWARAIDTYLYRADRARISRSAQFLAVYQSRQLLNRFGISPTEEAVLGLHAHAWSKELEPGLPRG